MPAVGKRIGSDDCRAALHVGARAAWEARWGAHCARHASLRRLDSSTAAPPMRKMQPGMHMLRCLPR